MSKRRPDAPTILGNMREQASGRTDQSTGLCGRQVTGRVLANAALKTADRRTRQRSENSVNRSIVVAQAM